MESGLFLCSHGMRYFHFNANFYFAFSILVHEELAVWRGYMMKNAKSSILTDIYSFKKKVMYEKKNLESYANYPAKIKISSICKMDMDFVSSFKLTEFLYVFFCLDVIFSSNKYTIVYQQLVTIRYQQQKRQKFIVLMHEQMLPCVKKNEQRPKKSLIRINGHD